MRRIAITPPDWRASLTPRAVHLLHCGVERVHLRTVGASAAELASLIEAFPEEFRPRLTIHEHFHLASRYGVGGIHLNRRFPDKPEGWTGTVSRSCHSLAEVAADTASDYLFLSPVADSISKPDYRAAFTHEELQQAHREGIITPRVFALGGITPHLEDTCRELGFGGVAMMGMAFAPVNREHFKLQYITPDLPGDDEIAAAVARVLAGGCRWVQLRLKESTSARWLALGSRLAQMCRNNGATFLLDDRVELVKAVGADGVHLGKNDMPVEQARSLLGMGYIIGATANCAADILAAHRAGADYIGLGPLRFTTTKKNLSPVLGCEGYRSILTEVRAAGVTLPVVGIGGVVAADVAHLTQAGVEGVAVCGAIDQFLK